jgi:hypothetical protein
MTDNFYGTHDFSPISGYCIACGCHRGGLMALNRCEPSTDDSGLASDADVPDVDYSTITRGIVG